jgi:Cu-processing system permease protein
MLPTMRFVLITALRDRLFASLFVLLAILLSLSVYLGGAAVTEAGETSLVYAAGSARVLVTLGLAVFVAFHTERLHETRDVEALLSRPITRNTFVFSYWLAIGVIAVLTLLPLIVVIFAFQRSFAGAAAWSLTVLLESLVVVAFAIFAGLSFSRAIPTIFATVGFYALARLVGFFLGISEGTARTGINRIANPMMEYLGYLLPRLDLAGQTQWLVYGLDGAANVSFIVIQSLIYVILLLTAAMFDLRRRQF